ncbi:hypothetical protein [Gorillibacterium sp. sgz5001074]|uniref:hypothetical protein n=1 Tax=Gorillibacterium sp. sgz5001074 TaxID=3446695 RepID=UPI003F67F042
MTDLIKAILSDPISNQYQRFHEFCTLKDKGLRKKSFESLHMFIAEVKQWEEEEQRKFVCWLFHLFEITDNHHQVLVHPLEEQLLKPILEYWMNSYNDARPYRWFGLFLNSYNRMDYLKKAIELGGLLEQKALEKVIDLKLDWLWYVFHHINEDIYLGRIKEDRKIIDEIGDLLSDIQDVETKKGLENAITYYKKLMDDWEEFGTSSKSNFVEWCTEKGRQYHWVKAFYYK